MEPTIVNGRPVGKPAGVRCVQLTDNNLCRLFEKPERPAACTNLNPSQEMCGNTDAEAFAYLTMLEETTRPESRPAGSGLPQRANISHL